MYIFVRVLVGRRIRIIYVTVRVHRDKHECVFIECMCMWLFNMNYEL